MAKQKKKLTPEEEVDKLIANFEFKPFYEESFTLSSRIGEDQTNAMPSWMWHKDLPESSLIRALKLKCKTYENVEKDWTDTKDPFRDQAMEWLKENWDSIEPYGIEDIYKLSNIEHRRLLFNLFGVEAVWGHISKNAKLLDRQVLKKERKRWKSEEEEYSEYKVKFDDIYELYEIPLTALFPEFKGQPRGNEKMYLVKMTCPSTGHKHMIYVPREVGVKNDAVEAIAWTFELNITNPESIYRQGDVLIAKKGKNSESCSPYHMTKEMYLKPGLMVSET